MALILGSCGMLSASEVRVWGSTSLTDRTAAENTALYTVPAGLVDATQVAISDRSVAALRATGEVVVWGVAGQPRLTVPVLAQSGVIQISASFDAFHALRSDGTVVTWGVSNASVVTMVPSGLTNVIKVHGGQDSAIAIKSDGTVVGWGNDWVSPTVGFTCQDAFPNAIAIQSNGSLSHWNTNPTQVALNIPVGLTASAIFSDGSLFAGAVSASGAVTMWGPAGASELNVPAGITGIKQIALGYNHVVALATNGALTMWGNAVVLRPEIGVPFGWSGCQGISAGYRFTAAVFTLPPNGSAPTNMALTGQAVEFQAVANTAIGTFTLSDADPGDRHSYALISGTGSTDNAMFSIVGTQLRVGSTALTAAGASSLVLLVRATDSGGLFTEKSFTITVGPAPIVIPPNNEASKGGLFGGCGAGSGLALLLAALAASVRLVVRIR